MSTEAPVGPDPPHWALPHHLHPRTAPPHSESLPNQVAHREPQEHPLWVGRGRHELEGWARIIPEGLLEEVEIKEP